MSTSSVWFCLLLSTLQYSILWSNENHFSYFGIGVLAKIGDHQRRKDDKDTINEKIIWSLPFHHEQVKKKKKKLPNIVILLADNLGHGDISSFGSAISPGRTPNIDRYVVREGRKLSAWNSVDHLCSPSRASLLTGRYPIRSGVYPGVFKPDSAYGMSLQEVTLAEYLKEHGNYATSIIGKWHLGHTKGYLPTDRGFDEWIGLPYHPSGGSLDGHVCGYDKQENQWLPLYKNDQIIQQPVQLNGLAHVYANAADDFIRRHSNNDDTHKHDPFFLYVPFSHVHQLCAPVRESCQWATTTTTTTKITKNGTTTVKEEDILSPSFTASFGDAVEEMDWIAGQIFSSLQKYNVDDNTIVLFTSDNGPWLAEQKCSGSRGPFEGRWLRDHLLMMHDDDDKKKKSCTACPHDYKSSPTPDRPRRCIHNAMDMTSLGNKIYTLDGVPCGEDVGLGSLWEANIRVPAAIRWKGIIEPGTESMEAISTIDVVPTLLSLLFQNNHNEKNEIKNNIIAGDSNNNHNKVSYRKQMIQLDGVDASHVLFPSNNDDQQQQQQQQQHLSSLEERPLFFWRDGFADGHLPPPYGRFDVCAVKLGRIKLWFYTKSSHYNDDPMVYHDPPLLFDWLSDPAEAYPLDPNQYKDLIDKVKQLVQQHKTSIGTTHPLTFPRDPKNIPCADPNNHCRTKNTSNHDDELEFNDMGWLMYT